MPFDPFKDGGATELTEDFDPFKSGAATEEQGYLADKARRLGRAIPKAIGDTVASAGSAVQSGAELAAEALRWRAVRSGDMTEAEAAAAKARFLAAAEQTAPMQAAQAIRDVGQELTDVGPRRFAAPDPARNDEIGSAVTSGAASLVPLLAAGAAAPLAAIPAAAGYMGETQRQDAAEKGATPTQQAAAFALGAPVGAASEALLGVPQLLKSVGGAKAIPGALASAANGLDGMLAQTLAKVAPAVVPVAQQAVKSAVREGIQEGLEQIAQNTLAKDVVAYDPTRDRTEGAGMAMLAGSLVGGGVGAAYQAGQELDTRQNIAESKKTLLAQQQQLVRGLRPAQMFPVDADGKVTNELPLPPEMARVATERGVFHYNPALIDEATLLKLSGAGRENGPLGLGSQSKADVAARVAQGDEIVAVTERAPDGTEVKTAVSTRDTATKTIAELEASKTPGNTVQTEPMEKPIKERSANFVADLLAQDATAAAAARETAAKEEAARTARQKDLDEKKARFDERLALARQTLADPAAPFAAVDGVLKTITSYAEDNALGLTQTQREQAAQTQAALQKRHAQLAPAATAAADAEAATRRTEAKLAEDAKAEKIRRERAALQHLETTGRDLATGKIVDLQYVPDAELETLSSQPSALSSSGLTPTAIETEIERRGQAAERAAATSNESGYTLRDLIIGKRDALAAAGRTQPLRLKSPAALALEGGTMAGEHRAIGERQGGFRIFSDTGLAEDTLQEQLQQLGFTAPDVPTAYALYERALGGEDIRPERSGEDQVEFAEENSQLEGFHASLGEKIAKRIADAPRSDYSKGDTLYTPRGTAVTFISDLLPERRGKNEGLQRALVELPDGSQSSILLVNLSPEAPGAQFAAQPAAPRRAPLTDADIDAQLAALRREFPALTRDLDLRSGLVGEELARAGYRGPVPAGVQAAILQLKAEKRLLVIAAQSMRQGEGGGLFLHEMAHPFFDSLPVETKEILRQLHAQEMATQTGPLFDAAGNLTTDTFVRADQFSAERLRRDPDLPLKEWFAERLRALNADWLAGRTPRDHSTLVRVWRELLAKLRSLFARIRGMDTESDLFTTAFRRWLDTGAKADLTRTGLAYAERTRADFASFQDTLDLGSTPLGLTLPNEIRNLAPRWQDKTLQFDSSLDKALYYAGGTPGELRTRIIDSIAQQTQLTAGQIATLARDLRTKLAPLARTTATTGTLRVPPQMQSPVRMLTATNFATGKSQADASSYRQKDGTYSLPGLLRGIGKKANDHGVAGKGPYFTTRDQIARTYATTGKIERATITLRNPLIATYSELDALQTKLYGRSLTGFQPELSAKFDRWMRDQGYDGALLYDLEISRTKPEEVVKLAAAPQPDFAEGPADAPIERLAAKQIDATPDTATTTLAQKWIKVMPAFQGGKYQMAEPVAAAIAKTMTPEQREQIDTVVDYFGGGGMWGGYLALTHFPNAKRLVVYEINPRRAAKIQLFHERGDQLGQILAEPAARALLDGVTQEAQARETTSGSALATLLEKRVTPDTAGIVGALWDAALSARGRAFDANDTKTAAASMAKLRAVAIRDAADAYSGAAALRARGITTEVRTGDSYQGEIVPGKATLAVMDPPYYNTRGYDGKIVGLGTYEKTGDMLRRLAAAGNSIIYTDAAWHVDAPEMIKATGDLFTGGLPADQANLGNIVDSLNAFSIVPLEGRHELLGINQPGHTQGATAIAKRAPPTGQNLLAGRGAQSGPRNERVPADDEPAAQRVDAQDSGRGADVRRDAAPRAENLPSLTERLAEVERRLADLANSQEDPADLEPRGQALEAERDQLKREIATAEQTAATTAAVRPASAIAAEDATRNARHPLAVATPEPGDAWAMAPKMTDTELAQERERITTHTHDNFAGLAPAERAALQARVQALTAEQLRRDIPTGATVTPIPKVDRRTALLAELTRGRALRDQGDKTGNAAAMAEGVRLVRLATETLDAEFPGWDAKTPATQAAATQPPLPPEPPTAEAAPASEGDGEQSPFSGAEEDTMPVRAGKFAEVYGHSSYQPSFLAKSWQRVRRLLTGIKGPIPELPTFPAAWWNRADTFIREHGPQFYARVSEGERALKSANDHIQRTAEEQIGRIITPLLNQGEKFAADDYARLRARQEQARRTIAEGRPVPPGIAAEIAALNSKMESSPYVLFNRLVFALDLHWRATNLKDDRGSPIALPANVNIAEAKAEVQRLGERIAASPHAAIIKTALEQHMALVKQTAADLKARELLAADHLANPYYFPHLTLEKRGEAGEIEQRELTPARVRPGTDADFRGYLETPVGSAKAIESDYVRAMYYHLVQVGAHNFAADAKRDYFRPYDIMATVQARAKELTKQRGRPVSWDQAFNEEFAPRGYVKYGTDSRDAFPTLTVNRDALARRLGVMLTSEDLHQQLAALGQKGIQLLPEDIRETLSQGERETWIVPARVAEALRGIGDRLSAQDNALEAAAKFTVGQWKAWKLFMPWNHVRYEYGNVIADLEKLISSSPGTFKQLPAAAKEMRDFWTGGEPSADLRAALKEGVINAITAQEMDGLTRQKAFEAFQTRSQKAWDIFKRRGSSIVYQPATSALGLGDFSSPELSALREAITRYAKFKSDLAAIRAGARPDYAGAYWKNIEAMTDSRPGADDAAVRKAAAISKATFGDYGDLSVLGQTARDRFIPFYSWMEINFRYHANLLRNLRDMVRAEEMTAPAAAGRAARTVAITAAGLGARTAGAVALRLALPYMAVFLWNNSGDRDELEKLLSEEDRRRFHLILGRDAQGKVNVVYGNTALMDVMKWFSGPKFAQAMAGWMSGKTNFTTAVDAWTSELDNDLANNIAGSIGPGFKIPYALGAKKATFPDVTDQRSIPAYDMRRHILGQVTDEFTADAIERVVSKDYYGSKDLTGWAKQLILQVRQRDPDSWAFYAIKDKANDYLEKRTGTKRDSSFDAPDQQVLRNFRRAIYRGDVDKAVQFYQRLLDYGYTAERFAESIRSQDPLSVLPKQNGLRQEFEKSLTPDERAQLDRAYAYYQQITGGRGRERQLFPSKASGLNGQMRYQAQPRTDTLRALMERTDTMTDEERRARAQRDERRSLQRTN